MPADGEMLEFGALIVIFDSLLFVRARYLDFEVEMVEVLAEVADGKVLAEVEERRVFLWNGQR